MPKDRGTKPEPDALVDIVDRDLPASTALERSFMKVYLEVEEEAFDDAERFVGYDAAQDALQQTSLKVWERWKKLQPEQRNKAYFLTAFRNCLIDHVKHEDRHVELTEELEESPQFPVLTRTPEGEIDAAPILAAIFKAMPPRRKQVLTMAKHLRLTHQQIAAALGVSVSTVETHISLAKESIEKGFERVGIRLSAGTARKLIPPTTEEHHG